MIRTCLALLSLAVPTAQAAEPPRVQLRPAPAPPAWQLVLHRDTVWRRDGGYRVFSSDGQDQAVGLSLLRQVRRGQRLNLDLGLGWHREQTEAQDASGGGDLDVNNLRLLAMARLQVRPWLQPHLRLGAGVSHGAVDLFAGQASYEASRWAPSGEIGAGVTLSTRTVPLGRARIAATLLLEGGLQFGTPMTFEARARDGYAMDDAIPTRTVTLGDLSRNHPYLRLGVGLAF
jgi:opacity protein-like surface antigen